MSSEPPITGHCSLFRDMPRPAGNSECPVHTHPKMRVVYCGVGGHEPKLQAILMQVQVLQTNAPTTTTHIFQTMCQHMADSVCPDKEL